MKTGQVDVLVGLQYGDEGKGKVIDTIAGGYGAVVRYQGGANSGHTVYSEAGEKLIFNVIPSGMAKSRVEGIISGGVVIDPLSFMAEADRLSSSIKDLRDRLFISGGVHITFPTHRLIDHYTESGRVRSGSDAIGSTKRGNTPTYSDKVMRVGVTIGDLIRGNMSRIYNEVKERHMLYISEVLINNNDTPTALMIGDVPFEEYEKQWMISLKRLVSEFKILMSGTAYMLNGMLNNGKRILLEAAQGLMLDIDWGTYPFVTSSSVTTASAFNLTGLPIQSIGRVYGVFKPYLTRVGAGYYPTEILAADSRHVADAIIQKGREFGSVTGRERRIGYLDIPCLKYACMIDSVTDMIMTKVDVISGLDMRTCDKYDYSGIHLSSVDRYTTGSDAFLGSNTIVKKKYQALNISVTGEERMQSDLSDGVMKLIEKIDKAVGSLPTKPRVSSISISPERGLIPIN